MHGHSILTYMYMQSFSLLSVGVMLMGHDGGRQLLLGIWGLTTGWRLCTKYDVNLPCIYVAGLAESGCFYTSYYSGSPV